MDKSLEQPPVLQRKSYLSPLTVLVLAVFMLTLSVSGVRVQDTVAAREPVSPWGQIVAAAAALCIERKRTNGQGFFRQVPRLRTAMSDRVGTLNKMPVY